MSRVSDSELRELVDARSGEALTGFIEDAHTLVDEILGTNSGHSQARLKLIEKNLAGHFWVIAKEKGGLTLERALDAENNYAKYTGTGLSATRFGAQVQLLDTTGELDKVLSYTKKAILRVV